MLIVVRETQCHISDCHVVINTLDVIECAVTGTGCNVDNCQKCDPKDANSCVKCDDGYSLIAPDECKG